MDSDTAIRLAGYSDESTLFELDRDIGTYRKSKVPNAWKQGRISGVAEELPIGLFHRANSLVAVIADRRSLWLRFDTQEFDLRDPSFGIRKRSTLVPFSRKFLITRHEQLILSAKFWASVRLELSEWGDIFDWIANLGKEPSEVVRTMLRWNATASGLDVTHPNVQADLERQFQLVSREPRKTTSGLS